VFSRTNIMSISSGPRFAIGPATPGSSFTGRTLA
jgi:hypothetical protein